MILIHKNSNLNFLIYPVITALKRCSASQEMKKMDDYFSIKIILN